jgi:hypothetical protein
MSFWAFLWKKAKAFERLKKHKEAVKATKRTIELDESNLVCIANWRMSRKKLGNKV